MTFDQKLKNYADLIVQVGTNVQPGQNVMFRAPVEGADLARLVVESAYRAGARHVDLIWTDDAVTLSTYRHAADDAFGQFSPWQAKALNEAAERGDAFIEIRASDPTLLKDQDPERVARAAKARRVALQPFMTQVTSSGVNWCLVTMPIASWAQQVFPDSSADAAFERLWHMIFRAVRADQADPLAAWASHLAALEQRRHTLTDKRYAALHFTGPGTDLKVGLPEGHLWFGGSQPTKGGISYVANLPTEEVFTLPHRARVEGVVRNTLPLSYNGTLIDGFELNFKAGEVVAARAEQGEAILKKLLETDAGARRLGEVALVPASSPIARMGTLFYHTLFDENASSHIALGRAYAFTLQGGTQLSKAEAEAAGVNDSLEHVDFMIGSTEVNVDGVSADGQHEPIMRGGEWAF